MKMSFPSNSRYLAKEDFTIPGQDYIISGVVYENMDDGVQKPVLYVQGHAKGIVLNQVNGTVLLLTYGDESDNWRGKPINIFQDPTVQYAGRVVGGIRLRMPGSTQPQPGPASVGAAAPSPIPPEYENAADNYNRPGHPGYEPGSDA